MALFDIFKRRITVEKPAEIDEIKEMRKEEAKIRAQHQKERMRLDLEKMRIAAQRERAELEEDMQEQRLEREIRRAERQLRWKELQEELAGDDDEEEEQTDGSPESMLFSIISKAMNNNSQSPASQSISPPSFQTEQTPVATFSQSSPSYEDMGGSPSPISYEKIKARWDSLPANYKMIAKQMSDDQLRAYFINEMPDADKTTLETAIKVVRSN